MKVVSQICCGCSACASVCPKEAISIKMDEYGDYIAVINEEKCVACGLCEKVCAFHSNKEIFRNSVKDVYSIKKKKKRRESQSGGAFSAIAEYYLKHGGIVYGVDIQDDTAYYERIDCIKKLDRLKKSKYVHAQSNDTYKRIVDDLNSEESVLVSGTPCYIQGLYSFLNIRKANIENLTTVDLICHGTPRPMVFSDYFDYLSQGEKKIKKFIFRYKIGKNWGTHFEKISYSNKAVYSNNYSNIFYSHLCFNKSCYVCPYANLKRIADITVGDCWGIEENDGKGTSIVLVNTEKGADILKKIDSDVIKEEYELDLKYQPNLCKPSEKNENYEEFWGKYIKEGFLPAVKEYCSFDEKDFEDSKIRMVKDIRDSIIVFLGRIKRIVIKKLKESH